mgnify:CR=1 FL=1
MDTDTIINIIVIALLALFVYNRMKPASGLKTLKAGEFQQELSKNPMLIDVREPDEYKAGFISGARNIPLSQLSKRVNEIPKDEPILLYCRSGIRSKSAARVLLKNGYTNLTHLQGGLGGWNGKLTRS